MARPRRLVFYLVAYFSLIMALRLGLFPGGADDDGEILYYSQSWALAYKSGQPPLYAWLIMAVQAVFGPSMAGVLLVKYLLLVLFYGFSYLMAWRLFRDNAYALAVPLGLMSCYFIGWETVVSYSHTVLAMAAMAATLWLILRLEDHNETRDYLWLGLALAVGLLAKYTFAVFLVPVLVATWCYPKLRSRVFSKAFAASLGVAIVVAALPTGIIWSEAGGEHGAQLMSLGKVGSTLMPAVEGRIAATAEGMFQFVLSSLGLVSPFILVAVFLFPGAFRPLSRPDDGLVQGGRFLEIYLVTLLLISIVTIVIFAIPDVRANWLVVWFPAVAYGVLRIKVFVESADGAAALGRRRWFCGILLVLAASIPLGLLGRGFIAPDRCQKCNFFIPYVDMAQNLRAAGFSGGTIIAADYPNQLAGNLRRYFPTARVISTRWRDYPRLPLMHASQSVNSMESNGPCLLIWRGDEKSSGAGETRTEALQRLGMQVANTVPVQSFSLTLPRASGRTLTWSYRLITNHELCR